MWRPYNENPGGARVGDCVVRAIATVTGQEWEETYIGLCLQGFIMRDMPSSNAVWGAYLHERGFTRGICSEECPKCYTVRDFCAEHRAGRYIMAISGHVVAVIDGDYIDTWDSGDEIPLYYWTKKEEE